MSSFDSFDFESNFAELKALLAELQQEKAMPKLTNLEDLPILQVPEPDTAECEESIKLGKFNISRDVVGALHGMRYFLCRGYTESTAIIMEVLARFCGMGAIAAEQFVCDIFMEEFGEELEDDESDILSEVVGHLFWYEPIEDLRPELLRIVYHILIKVNT